MTVSTPAETAESRAAYLTCESGFTEVPPKRKRRQRDGVAHLKKHEGGKSAPADSNPRKHGAEPVSLPRQSAKTHKVSQAKVAVSKLAERASKAAAAKRVSASKARATFVSRREELLKPVKAFGDHVGFLPSIPATEVQPIHSIGYHNALVEMASQSLAFVRK